MVEELAAGSVSFRVRCQVLLLKFEFERDGGAGGGPFSLHATRLGWAAWWGFGDRFVFDRLGGWSDGGGRGVFLGFEHRAVFGDEVAHVRFSERGWDPVEADLETRSETRGLLGVLGSEFAGAFGDWGMSELFSIY